jgi:hypothetical protein
MPRNVPYKDFPGVPGVKVATFSTPACDDHIELEHGDWCPYCAIKQLLSAVTEIDRVEAITHARAVMKRSRRRR